MPIYSFTTTLGFANPTNIALINADIATYITSATRIDTSFTDSKITFTFDGSLSTIDAIFLYNLISSYDTKTGILTNIEPQIPVSSGAPAELTNKVLITPTISSIVNGGLLTLPTGPDSIVGSTDGRLATPQQINVKQSNPGTGEFTSIALAVASILDSSITKPYVVKVGPGVYPLTSTITVPSYVSIIGSGIGGTFVSVVGAIDGFNLSTRSVISGIAMANTDSSHYAIIGTNIFSSQIDNVYFTNCPNPIKISVSSTNGQFNIRNITVIGSTLDTLTVLNTSGGANTLNIAFNFINVIGHCDNFLKVSGVGTTGVIQNSTILGDGSGNCFNILDGATLDARSIDMKSFTNGFLTGDSTLNNPNIVASSILFYNITHNFNVTNRSTIGRYDGITDFSSLKTIINPFCAFSVSNHPINSATVAAKGGDYTSIVTALSEINFDITVTTTNTSATITSTGLFHAALDGVIITGTGIPASTTATFVDENTITMSNSATASGTITATFVRASSTSTFTIVVSPGTYTEAETIVIPQYVFVTATTQGSSVIVPGGNFDCFTLQDHAGLNNLTIANVNSTKWGIHVVNGVDTKISSVVIMDCSQCILMDGALETNTNIYIYDCTLRGDTIVTGIKVFDSSTPGARQKAMIDNMTFTGHADTLLLITGANSIMNCRDSVFNGDDTGTCFDVQNGGDANIIGTRIAGWKIALTTSDTITNSPNINATGCIIDECEKEINIINSTTTGQYVGIINISKVFINTLSLFCVSDRAIKSLIVNKKGSDFATIALAIAFVNPIVSISTTNTSTTITSASLFNISMNNNLITGTGIPASTTATFVNESTMTLSNPATATGTISATIVRATATTPYSIIIEPDVYSENALVIPAYVTLIGRDKNQCVIQPTDVSGTLITFSAGSGIYNLTIKGVTNGIGVLVDSVQTLSTDAETIIDGCLFNNCSTSIKCTSTTSRTGLLIHDVTFTGVSTYGILMDGTTINTGANVTEVRINSLYYGVSNNNFTAVKMDGPNINATLDLVSIDGNEFTNLIGYSISDGADVTISASHIDDAEEAVKVINSGAGPKLTLLSSNFANSNSYDINILHPNTTGVISTVAQKSKVFVDPASTISVSYIDPVVNGQTIIGSLFLGGTNDDAVDAAALIQNTPAMGVIDGGVITAGAGLSIDVTAGFGYVMAGTFPAHILTKYTWNNSNLVVSASSAVYIYINTMGTLTSNTSKPATTSNILLGRVITDATSVVIIDASPVNSHHISNKFDNFNRDVFGGIYVSGSMVTANASGQIAVTSGKYYYSGNLYTPTGLISPGVYTSYYHSAGTFVRSSSQTILDNTQYDNETNLIPVGSIMLSSITISTTSGNASITSAGLFTSSLNGYIVTAIGVPNNTTATYVNASVMTLSNNATATGSVSANFIVASSAPLSVTTTSSSSTVTSAGLFTSELTKAQVIGTGIPLNTHVRTFTDASNIVLSVPATASGSITATFIIPGRISIGTTNTSTTITSSGLFTSDFVGATVTGAGIPGGTLVASFTNTNSMELDTPATATATINAIFVIGGYYTKSVLYTVGQSTNEQYMMIYSPDQYTSLSNATTATLATPPTYFVDGIVAIASIVVQRDDNTYSSISSERPLPSFSASAISSTINHGSLLGLGSDDHTQYLRIDGSRAMTGSLDLGGFAITNPGLISGVNITAHGSRHLPNTGADALTTGAPTTTLSATTTNTTGTANSFSRSDHVHAISTGNVSSQTPDQSNSAGVSANLARADHVHNIATATAVSITSANAQGVAATFARSDHTHQGIHSLKANSGGTQRFNDIVIQQGTNTTVVDNGSGTFTIDAVVGTATITTLTNKTLTSPTLTSPNIAIIVNTGTLTLPTITDTILGRTTTDILTNKTLITPTITSIINTGLISLPEGTDTLVGRSTTDILTNKTLITPTIVSLYGGGGLISMPSTTDTLIGKSTVDTLTNKTITAPTMSTIRVGGGILTIPTGPDTLVARTSSDTLTNKIMTTPTLTSPVVSNLSASQVVVSDASKILTSSIGANNSSLFTSESGVLTWTGNTFLSNDNTVYGLTAGSASIFDNTSSHNTMIGYSTGNALATTTYYNTFVGSSAGQIKTTGDNNTLLGSLAGFWITIGGDNTYVGFAAGNGQAGLSANTFGNTGVGASVLLGMTTGDNNTGVGLRAGDNIQTGNNNTFLGADADGSTTSLSNAMALGYQASVDQDNAVVIGNSSITLIRGDSAGLCDLGTSSKQFGNMYGNVLNLKNSTIVTNSSGATLTLPGASDTLVGRNTIDTLTNKTLTTPTIASIVNNGLLTLPNGPGTLVGRNTTDTLTNKTLVNGTLTLSNITDIQGTFTDIPTSGTLLYSRLRAGRRVLSQKDTFGAETTYQPSLWSNKVGWLGAPGNSTTVNAFNLIVTTTGTALARNVATTNILTQSRRIGYRTNSLSTITVGWRSNALQWWAGNAPGLGGYFFVCRFGLSSTDINGTQRGFIGFNGVASVIGNTNPSTVADVLGFGFDSGETSFTFMHTNGTTAPTKDVLTGTFSSTTMSTELLEARIYVPSNSSTVYYSLEVMGGGSLFESSTSVNIPSNTTLLAAHVCTSSGTNTATTAIDICNIYIESE